MKTEAQSALVAVDGIGGLVLLDAPEAINEHCTEVGTLDAFDNLISLATGVYRVPVSLKWETPAPLLSDGPGRLPPFRVVETGEPEQLTADLSFISVSDRDRAETEPYVASLQTSENIGLSTESTASITGECAEGGKQYKTAMVLGGDNG